MNLKEKFKKRILDDPTHSTAYIFSQTVRGMKMNQRVLRMAFDELVDPEDYARQDKEDIIRWLISEVIKK